MKLDDSLFVSPEVHARTVKLGDDTEHPLHFKEIDSAEFRRFQLSEQSDDAAERVKAPARLIAASLCSEEGKPALTVDQAGKLKPRVTQAMLAVIYEVNGFIAKKDSPSADTTGSATS